MITKAILVFAVASTLFSGCTSKDKKQPEATVQLNDGRSTNVAMLTYSVKEVFPHQRDAFTQGLEVYRGQFIESTGLLGSSTLRYVDIKTGVVKKSIKLNDSYFGEGSTVLNDKIYTLTWQNRKVLVSDARTFKQLEEFSYSDEGWGICNDGTRLYKSNGTNMISIVNPLDFSTTSMISVTLNGAAVTELNELEWINGEIWANVWRTEKIVVINPTNGIVTKVLDLAGILPREEMQTDTDVMNGIAWDSATNTMYITGKKWPYVYGLDVR